MHEFLDHRSQFPYLYHTGCFWLLSICGYTWYKQWVTCVACARGRWWVPWQMTASTCGTCGRRDLRSSTRSSSAGRGEPPHRHTRHMETLEYRTFPPRLLSFRGDDFACGWEIRGISWAIAFMSPTCLSACTLFFCYLFLMKCVGIRLGMNPEPALCGLW